MDLRVRLGEAMAHQEPEVRAAAVEAIGRAVASPAVLAAIAASTAPDNVRCRCEVLATVLPRVCSGCLRLQSRTVPGKLHY